MAAHIPYRSVLKHFDEEKVSDRYDNCLYTADTAIGELLEDLRARGRLEKTLLLFFSDHGQALGEHLESLHGSSLYDMSVRIPVVLSNPVLFPNRQNLPQRFQIKDLSTTLLALSGLPEKLRQSENIFARSADEKIYFSNVFRDFKLGMLRDDLKFVFRPERRQVSVYDTKQDPKEDHDLFKTIDPALLAEMKRETLQYYFAQLNYLQSEFP